MTGTGIETATGTETVVEIGIEAEEIDIETHVEEVAPEVLEEVRAINVQVRTIYFNFRSKVHWGQRGTGETIVTTIGGTLIDGSREMIVEETTGGMNATATGKILLGIETNSKIPRISLPQGQEKSQVSSERQSCPRRSLFVKPLRSRNHECKAKVLRMTRKRESLWML